MKSTIKYIAASLLAVTALTGCRDEYTIVEGEGTLRLSTSVDSEVKVVSRAMTAEQEAELAEKTVIWISNSKGLLHEYIGASNVPSTLRLFSGHYVAEAWVGDSVPASWDKTFYKTGFVGFDIAQGQNTDLTLKCTIANTLASVSYTDEALQELKDPVMTISLDDGVTDGTHSLVFDGSNPDAIGHFMINSRTKGLVWTLTGTQPDGTEFTKTGTIKNIKPATQYNLNVKYVSHDVVIGGSYFDIELEEEPIGKNTQIEVMLPPNIEGIVGFDETNTFRGEGGSIDRKSIFISAGTALDEVELSSSLFTPIVGDERVELLHISGAPEQALNDAGINWIYLEDNETGMSGIRINFEDLFTNALPEGEHTIDVTAEDHTMKTSTATFTIIVTNAPALPVPVEESTISYTSATLEATLLKEASEYGFEVRQVSASRAYETWTKVPAKVSGTRIYAELTDLKAGTTYEYRVYGDDYVSTETVTFTTVAYPQLPNAGFENWSTDASDNALLPCAKGDQLFWDSGNHGSQKMSKNITESDNSIKHSGNCSARLSSQFVGLGSLGKFAAGNIFIGKYLGTDGMDGILGWGRPWEFRPTAVKLWVKYTPVAVTSDNSEYTLLKKGDMDKGIIYIALLTDATFSSGKGSDWPVVVKTKSSDRSVFNKDADNVLGYGEMVFSEATGDMIQVTIPIDYKSDAPVKNIMMVASASIGGDYFTGGNGSTMWIDDIELVY